MAQIIIRMKLTDQEINKYVSKLNSVLQVAEQRDKKGGHILSTYNSGGRFRVKELKIGIDVLIGLLLISIGLAMIIIPAPFPAFEIATLFYFNEQDGVTVMDLISLFIIFFGSKVIIETLSKIE